MDRNELLGAFQLARGEIDVTLWDEAVSRLSALQHNEDLEVVILLIPSAHIAYGSSSKFVDKGAKEVLLEFHEIQSDYLERQSTANGWKYRDLKGAFQSAVEKADKLLYFPGNLHLTALGHDIVASEVSNILLTE